MSTFRGIIYAATFLAMLGFTIAMVVDVARSRNLSTASKILWAIGIIMVPVAGPYVYFLARWKYAR